LTFLLDVNLLLALIWQSHEHNEIARNWLKTVGSFATCPISQLGFGRISSHPSLGYGMSPDEAFTMLRRFLADPRHIFIPDNLSAEDRIVRTDLMLGPNQVTDLYLAALARQHDVSLATLDQELVKKFATEPELVVLVRGK
jgi:toxin-antitoxin system PIN domain toxin